MPIRIAAGWRVSLRLFLITVTTLLSTSLFADDLTMVGDPQSLGFSAARLARIGAWYESQIPATNVPSTPTPRERGANSISQPPRDLDVPLGAVIAIARNGKLAYLKTVGSQNLARTVPMKTDSIFWISGMTKPVTSVAAMMLVDDGKLALDAPVSKYLPKLSHMLVGVPDKGVTGIDLIKRQAAKRAMTVRDLLRHTSGLVYSRRNSGHPVHELYTQADFRPERLATNSARVLSGLKSACV